MPSPDLFGLSQTGLVSSLLARTGSHVPSLLGLATASTCKIHDLCNLKPDRSFGIAADTQEARWGSSLHELREVRPATPDRRRVRTPAGFHRIVCHRRRRRPVHPLIDCQEQLGTALVSRTHWHYGPANAFGELVQLLATARYSSLQLATRNLEVQAQPIKNPLMRDQNPTLRISLASRGMKLC